MEKWLKEYQRRMEVEEDAELIAVVEDVEKHVKRAKEEATSSSSV